MLNGQTAAALNHLLAAADWAREALRPSSGKVVAIDADLIGLRLAVLPDGFVVAADPALPADLHVVLSLATAARIAAGDTAARALVRTEGDEALARAVWHVATSLRWDAEEDLSRVTGDIVAHRFMRTLRGAADGARDAAVRLGEAAAEYVTEEGALSPPRAELEAFLGDVDALRDDVGRLESRLARLERTLAGSSAK